VRPPSRQRGVVLFVALIMLVAMTIAAISIVRAIDTGNVIAGNLAFKEASLHATDIGIESAMSVLPTIISTSLENNQTPDASTGATAPTYWYFASQRKTDPTSSLPQNESYDSANTSAGTSIDWNRVPPLPAIGVSGYEVRMVIDRLCVGPPPVTDIQGKCISDKDAGGGSKRADAPVFTSSTRVYYRVTVQSRGPKNSMSIAQATVGR
jgi:Tfp pilus assembly protein PilX